MIISNKHKAKNQRPEWKASTVLYRHGSTSVLSTITTILQLLYYWCRKQPVSTVEVRWCNSHCMTISNKHKAEKQRPEWPVERPHGMLSTWNLGMQPAYNGNTHCIRKTQIVTVCLSFTISITSKTHTVMPCLYTTRETNSSPQTRSQQVKLPTLHQRQPTSTIICLR